MITEFAIATGIVCGVNYLKNPATKIKKDFNRVMSNNNLDYKIMQISNKDYGYNLIINLGYQGYEKLESTKDMLETALGYKIYIEQNKNLKTAVMDMIRPISNVKFEPMKIQPYELYIGKSFTQRAIISNMNKFPHVLVSGQTGCGKTEEIRIILTNLIYNYSKRDINLYFSDLSDTNDFIVFQNCNQTKFYARNIYDSLKLFKYLMHLYTKRLSIFAKFNCKNILEYNKKNHEKRMSYVYLILDEFADYFPANQHMVYYKEKQECYNILRELIRKSRKAGIFLIVGIQRPDTTVLDPSLRSGLCTKIAFSQNNNASSLTVCDSNELTNIENRQALFMAGNKREWFRTLDVNDKIIKKYVANSYIISKPYKENSPNKTTNIVDVKKYTEIKELPSRKKSKRRIKL